jgi:hypothetical protein
MSAVASLRPASDQPYVTPHTNPTHLLEVGAALLTQAAHVELALTRVTDDDGAITKRATQEVWLVAQHAAAAEAVRVVHHLGRPAHSTARRDTHTAHTETKGCVLGA